MNAKRLASLKAEGRPFTAIKTPTDNYNHLYKWLTECGVRDEEIPFVLQALRRALLRAFT